MATAPLANTTYRKAWLDLIAWAEGVQHGYNTLFGNGHFSSLASHPNINVPYRGSTSDAAGRYQFLYSTWKGLLARFHFPDFSAESQDRAALALTEGRGALSDVDAGRWQEAIRKCANEWASFPGNRYNQGGAKTMPQLLARMALILGGQAPTTPAGTITTDDTQATSGDRLTAGTRAFKVKFLARFPGAVVGSGYRNTLIAGTSNVSDHAKGLALDLPVSPGGTTATGAQRERGDEYADWAATQPETRQIIWFNRVKYPPGDWRPFTPAAPGVSNRHEDHVHVSIKPGSGTGAAGYQGGTGAAESIAGASGGGYGGANVDNGLSVPDITQDTPLVDLITGIDRELLTVDGSSAKLTLSTSLVSQLTLTINDPGLKILASRQFVKGSTIVMWAGWPMRVAKIRTQGGPAGTGQLVIECRDLVAQQLKLMRGPDLLDNISPSEALRMKVGFVLAQPTQRMTLGPNAKVPGQPAESWYDVFQKVAADLGFMFFCVAGKAYFAKPSYLVAEINEAVRLRWPEPVDATDLSIGTGLLGMPDCSATVDDPDFAQTCQFRVLPTVGAKFRPGQLVDLAGMGEHDTFYMVDTVDGQTDRSKPWTISCVLPTDPDVAAATVTSGGNAGAVDDGS